MQLTLDRLLERHVPVNHPLIAWLVEHGAFVRFTSVIGHDGKTAYSRVRGTENALQLPFDGAKGYGSECIDALTSTPSLARTLESGKLERS